MAKAAAPKKKKAKPKLTDKEQSERFIETARSLGSDESGEPFERVAAEIIKPPKQGSRREN
jgi:hypothetical protein